MMTYRLVASFVDNGLMSVLLSGSPELALTAETVFRLGQ